MLSDKPLCSVASPEREAPSQVMFISHSRAVVELGVMFTPHSLDERLRSAESPLHRIWGGH